MQESTEMDNISTATEQELIEAWESRDKNQALSIKHKNIRERLLQLRGLEVTRFNTKVRNNKEDYHVYFYGKIIGKKERYETELQALKAKWESIGLPFDNRSLEEKWLGSGYHAGGVL